MFDPPTLELLADDKESLAASQKAVRDRSAAFRREYLESHSQLKYDRDVAPLFNQLTLPLPMGNPFGEHEQADHYLKLLNTFRDLETGKFWGVIHNIDGSARRQGDLLWKHPAQLQQDASEQRQEAQKWAKGAFTDGELQELFTLVVNQALLKPYGEYSNLPGGNRGHSILFREFVEKPMSLFEKTIDENFLQRLVNGTFWEDLPHLQGGSGGQVPYLRVERVLTDFAYLLDPEFAPKGLEMFHRNARQSYGFDLAGLTFQGVTNYSAFVKKLDEHKEQLDLKQDDLDRLVRSYVTEVVRWSEDWNEDTIYPIDQPNGFDKRLNEPWLHTYVGEPGPVRTALSENIAHYADWYDSALHAATVLPHVPNPKEFLGTVFAKLGDLGVGKFASEFEADLQPLLTETTQALLDEGKATYEENRKRFAESDQKA
tara:strand:+ start:3042 stop:4328 length:1287 start_codon:yes stop_codon:yes gene_type:complete